ncbi:MAG: small subunit ribosomal protein [Acidobacteriota bacterium]|jgi:small subunit ribosomal protein S1|nr:small subunit ribosomal protein [Acidobacteriota bacterium]
MTQSREAAEANSFAEAFEASLNFKTPEQGELLRGQIVSISGDDAFVSYGGPSEAVMDAAELEGLDVGDTVEATVVKTGSEIRISRKMLKGKASLDQLRGMYENRLPVEGKVTGRNKGGFDVSVAGLRAFCPLSQIALGKIENPDAHVGQTYEFRVTELSDDGRRIVVSRAALMKEAAAQRADETRGRIVPGAELTGTVKTITPFGAFVDLGGIDGLLHVSEMSRRRVSDPKELVTVGQQVAVKVIKVENDGKRISLSMKDQEPDPWSDVDDRHPAGTQFTGRIVRSTDFGLFVEVEPGLDGLVHFSQLPLGVKQGDSSVAIGSTVSGWVREVDASKKRLSLSLREVAIHDPWENVQQKYPIGKVVEGTVDHGGAPGIFVQLEAGLTGLIPNSEIVVPHGTEAAQAHAPGEKLMVRIMSVDPQRRRISLSHEAAKAAVDREEYAKMMDERGESEGESAMAVAFRKAMEKK